MCANLIFVSGGLMDITISFRHIDADEEIKVYIEEKMARLQKYIETPLDVHVVLSLERKYRHRVDVMFTINGVVINAHEVMDDTRAAVDKILDKLERRLTKYRDKLKKYREAKTKRTVTKGEPEESNIIITKTIDAKPMDPEEATMQLRASGDNFIIFRERERDNCVYSVQKKRRQIQPYRNSGKKPVKLSDILRESCVIADIKGVTKREILFEMVETLKNAKLIDDVDSVVDIIMEREKLGSTGIGDGVAIPHGKMKKLNTILCVAGRSKEGVNFDAVDRQPVHIFFLVLAPEDSASYAPESPVTHLKSPQGPVIQEKDTETGRRSRDIYKHY